MTKLFCWLEALHDRMTPEQYGHCGAAGLAASLLLAVFTVLVRNSTLGMLIALALGAAGAFFCIYMLKFQNQKELREAEESAADHVLT